MADRGWLPEPATLQQMPVATPYLDGLLGITLRVPITISAAPIARPTTCRFTPSRIQQPLSAVCPVVPLGCSATEGWACICRCAS
jgi:hypothetical protein